MTDIEENNPSENTEGGIKHRQSRETVSIDKARRSKTKQKHNTICVGQQFTWK